MTRRRLHHSAASGAPAGPLGTSEAADPATGEPPPVAAVPAPAAAPAPDPLLSLSKEELIGIIDDYAKNWLTHDGLWFLEVEAAYGLEVAVDIDRETWRRFTVIEARRIVKQLGITPGSGIAGLKRAFEGRMYTRLNRHEIVEETETSLTLMMRECRIQNARTKKGLDYFPCGSVSIIQYGGFASSIDPRITTSCVYCPPDVCPGGSDGYVCGWRFDLIGQTGTDGRPRDG